MASRRRRRPAVTWLPTIFANIGDQSVDVQDLPAQRYFSMPVAPVVGQGYTGIAFTPITFDAPAEADAEASTTLADFTQSGYRLRRIVGKVDVTVGSAQDIQARTLARQPAALLVGAGFIVLRTDSDGVATSNELNLLTWGSIRDPWIWRRTWALSTGVPVDGIAGAAENERGLDFFPKTSLDQASSLDSAHFDTKIARLIGQEERLFFVVAAFGLPFPQRQTYVDTVRVNGLLEYRLLASPRKMTNRRNASR